MSPEDRIAKHNLQPYLAVIDPMWAHLNQFDYHAAVDAAERVRALVLAEREACAKIAEHWAAELIASEIRKRNEGWARPLQ